MKVLSKDKHYILGCSGGPDSMALLNMLLENGYSFDVAFVNYHKRKESVLEEAAVKKYCEENEIRFHLLSSDNKNIKGNFQAWARNYRYEFFYNLVKHNNYDGIIVAHHLDDFLETYVFQKNRKGIYSYYGLQEISFYKDVKVFRPLLDKRKKELENYCISNNVPYFIDSSNLKDDYTRNKIRHNFVEKLSKEEVDNLLKEIEEKNIENNKEKQLCEKFLLKERYLLRDFILLSDDLQKRVIYNLIYKIKETNGKEIKEIINFLKSNKNGKLEITDNVCIFKDYNAFKISEIYSDYSYVFESEVVFENELLYIDLIKGKEVFFIKEDSYPLMICNVKKEEKVKIGKIIKKVNRLFIDEKIPNYLRSVWPCIKDRNGKIIYFPRKKEERVNQDIIFKVKL